MAKRRRRRSLIPKVPSWKPVLLDALDAATSDILDDLSGDQLAGTAQDVVAVAVGHLIGVLIATGQMGRGESEKFLVATARNLTRQGYAEMIGGMPMEGSA